MPTSISIETVAPRQLIPLACPHTHPSRYHVPTVDKAAFGQSCSCHHRSVEVQDNCRVVQLLPALRVPTMVCLCSERSGRVVLTTFKPFLETFDCVSGAQLCCKKLMDCVCYNRFKAESESEACICVCAPLFLY